MSSCLVNTVQLTTNAYRQLLIAFVIKRFIMAGDEPQDLIRVKATYTFNEAIEYMKMKDKQPTKIGETIRWINVKTGKEVVIGYTS